MREDVAGSKGTEASSAGPGAEKTRVVWCSGNARRQHEARHILRGLGSQSGKQSRGQATAALWKVSWLWRDGWRRAVGGEGRHCLGGTGDIRDGQRGGDRWEDNQGTWKGLPVWGSSLSPPFKEQVHPFCDSPLPLLRDRASAHSLVAWVPFIFVSQGSHNKGPWAGRLETTQIYSHTILRREVWKQQASAGPSSFQGSERNPSSPVPAPVAAANAGRPPGSQLPPSALCPAATQRLLRVSISCDISPPYKDTSLRGLGPP